MIYGSPIAISLKAMRRLGAVGILQSAVEALPCRPLADAAACSDVIAVFSSCPAYSPDGEIAVCDHAGGSRRGSSLSPSRLRTGIR